MGNILIMLKYFPDNNNIISLFPLQSLWESSAQLNWNESILYDYLGSSKSTVKEDSLT